MTLLIDLAVRSSILLGFGLLMTACLAKRSAALRHRVLSATLLAAALVIPVSLALPEWNVTLPARVFGSRAAATPARPGDALTAALASPQPNAPVSTGQQASTPARTSSHPGAPGAASPIVVVWLAGVLVAVGSLIAGVVRVSRIAAHALRVEDRRWLQILENVAERYGVTRRIVIARTDSTDLLATWGVLRPQVLVPDHADDWTLDRVHVVLCHELAHIRRHDWLVQIGAQTLRAVLWFNPLAWMACTRLRRESEQACDDEVLGIGVGGGDYAAHLLELARQCRLPGTRWASALPMAHPSTLERRIAAMLNQRLDRRAPSTRAIALLTLAVLLVMLPVALLRARQAGPAPLTGTIYDVTGGVMPGVEVALVDANQSRWVARTLATGRFELPPVGPGRYLLEATVPGFRTLRQEFELANTPDWDRAITLQVGDLKESIMVRESRVTASNAQAPVRTTPQPVRVGGNIRAPRKVKDVRPVYPSTMREAGLTGVVPVEAVIGRDGTVSSVRVLSAQVHPDFAVAAVDAVRQWQFTPTLLNGAPVEVVMTVSVRFDLEG
jgi:TonB family protein